MSLVLGLDLGSTNLNLGTGTVTLGYPWEVGKVAVPKHKQPQHHHKPHHHHHVHHVGRALA